MEDDREDDYLVSLENVRCCEVVRDKVKKRSWYNIHYLYK